MAPEPLLQVDNLKTYFHSNTGILKAVDDVTFSLHRGEILCVVGESGSGKSVSALSIMGLTEKPGRHEGGNIYFDGQDLSDLDEPAMRKIRGNKISMIFQDPMRSLNPGFSIGDQISEILILHLSMEKSEARQRSIELLDLVGIAEPDRRYADYPHQFSGGMRQRVMIAMAISCQPDILIADEPTTALDVTIQAQILNLLQELCQNLNTSMILITHDIGIVAEIAQNVMVMYAGRVVEYGNVGTILKNGCHPYTRDLMNSLIRIEDDRSVELHSIKGSPPNLANLPSGCSYHPRCQQAVENCRLSRPNYLYNGGQHKVACHLAFHDVG